MVTKKSIELKGGVKKTKAAGKPNKGAGDGLPPSAGKPKSSSDKKDKKPAAKDEPKSQTSKKLKASEEIDGLFGQLKGATKKAKVGRSWFTQRPQPPALHFR